MRLKLFKKRWGKSLGLFMYRWRKNRKPSTPWGYYHRLAYGRCSYPSTHKYEYYGGKGIRCLITESDVKKIYIRDKAWKIKQPSLDRINSKADYALQNIRFIPMKWNIRRRFLKDPLTRFKKVI